MSPHPAQSDPESTPKDLARAEDATIPLDGAALAALQDAVIDWFGAEGRDLPWRRTRDPWRVLVPEVMLQQIRVARAIPFYEAFVARFPAPAALAAAPLSAAIQVWGDLGRYKRVVNLHRAARLIVADHGGRVPSEPAALRALPGVGPYTAGAVACFAFERDEAFLDTNLRRVLHRIFVGVDVPAPTQPERALQRLAQRVVPAGRAWPWNQGLMDLGAVVCTARRPACDRCPVRTWCAASPAVQHAIAARPPRVDGGRPTYRYDDFKRDRCRPSAGVQVAARAGGHRFYRGRVLAALRELPPSYDAGIDLRALGPRLRADFGEDDLPWLRGVVQSLEQDGLAVAEERPAYDAGSISPPDVRIKLPE